jgi:hypothetical protein
MRRLNQKIKVAEEYAINVKESNNQLKKQNEYLSQKV